MKKLLVSLLAALSFNALAVDAAMLITPSPLGIVLAYNSYDRDQKKVYYIRVESQAKDFEQAKKQAFRLASEQVAGTVVLSESELRNGNLTRDEIITYSSGLIDEYKIVNRYDGPGFVKLTMDVWITESVMAHRLLAKSATEKGVDGNALSTRVDGILDERRRGDHIVQAIMNDFPRRAFRVTSGTPDVYMDQYRNTRISVNVKIEWDERFTNAFEDAARQTGQKICRFGCADRRFFMQGYEFQDSQKLTFVDNYIKAVNPTVMVELQDINGRVAKRQCYLFNMGTGDLEFYTLEWASLNLKTGKTHRFRAELALGQDTANMSTLENVRVEIVPKAQCQAL